MNTCSSAATSLAVALENAPEHPLKSPVRFNRLFSFETSSNTLSSVENHRDEIRQSTLNRFDSLEERHNVKQKKTSTEFCHQCSQRFASVYGLQYHLNMHHPGQSILCADCHIIFRSSRTLKTHRHRCHSTKIFTLPDYHHLSSYLVVAFSSNQFPLMCEQGRLPLGQLSSKFFLCSICNLSFPCSRTLKYHSIKNHQRQDEQLCRILLDEIVTRIEEELSTTTGEIDALNIILAQHASQFGLVHKHVAVETRRSKQDAYQQIYPRCAHPGRTCANLCLDYLVSYEPYIRNHSYQIAIVPKGNPFGQGSIVSKLSSRLSLNDSVSPKEVSSPSSKRQSIKRMNSSQSDLSSSSSQSKKRSLVTFSSTKQQNELTVKIKETKLVSVQSSPSLITSSRKVQSKSDTRTLSSTSLIRAAKRSRSPTIALSVERSSQKRRQQRKKPVLSPSSVTITIDQNDNIEQENDDDDDNEIIPLESESAKQRQASSGSIEYVHVLSHDSQAASLNNIENLQSNLDDDDIIVCHSPPRTRKPTSSSLQKTSPHYPYSNKANPSQTPDDDEHVRVRCKVCGDILEGRSRFSAHVLTMHAHLLNKKMSNGQQQQQTAIVR